ncbi:hypothetical protein [Comamonas badia]|uniref:hypothetical protein n=1 Tax=Comamonas badia TaxID=265291 RepID=UPI00041A7608|nr:hypothetical protein [Comamonas badia]
MKKSVLALGVAAALGGFAGSALAITDAAPVPGTATALTLSPTGTGHILIVPYYSAQNGNKTLLSLTNTDNTNGKIVKIRFRGAANSDDVNDFQVFLSPGDVWTADIHQGPNGVAALTTADKSCTKPADVNGDFGTGRFKSTWDADRLASNTREGYIEILNMADVPPAAALYNAIKHKDGVAACASSSIANGTAGSAAAWTYLDGNPKQGTGRLTADLTANTGITTPTTGLMANWTIINVPRAVAWAGAATAVEATTGPGTAPTDGAIVYFPQVNQATGGDLAGIAGAYTADPLLTGALVVGDAQFDLPDLSTPYAGAANPSLQAQELSTAISTSSVSNEFWTLQGIFGATDWVFSMPTRRYALAVDYTPATSVRVYNAANATQFAAANTAMNGDQACVTGVTWNYWNREEATQAGDVTNTTRSPGGGAPAGAMFCGETSVLSINDVAAGTAPTKALGAEVAVTNFEQKSASGSLFEEGWMKITTPGAVATNLPILGSAFMLAVNPDVDSGTSGNFNMTFPHRTER